MATASGVQAEDVLKGGCQVCTPESGKRLSADQCSWQRIRVHKPAMLDIVLQLFVRCCADGVEGVEAAQNHVEDDAEAPAIDQVVVRFLLYPNLGRGVGPRACNSRWIVERRAIAWSELEMHCWFLVQDTLPARRRWSGTRSHHTL